eukprot:469047-Pelagomonas_calceolata.AAC.5
MGSLLPSTSTTQRHQTVKLIRKHFQLYVCTVENPQLSLLDIAWHVRASIRKFFPGHPRARALAGTAATCQQYQRRGRSCQGVMVDALELGKTLVWAN